MGDETIEGIMKQTYLEVYFTEESGLLNLRVNYKKIISVKIADGLLKYMIEKVLVGIVTI